MIKKGSNPFTWLIPPPARLTALALGILATTGVWATDYKYMQVWSEDFECVENYDANLSNYLYANGCFSAEGYPISADIANSSDCSISYRYRTLADGSTSIYGAAQHYRKGSGSASGALVTLPSIAATATNWQLEFDFYSGSGSNNGQYPNAVAVRGSSSTILTSFQDNSGRGGDGRQKVGKLYKGDSQTTQIGSDYWVARRSTVGDNETSDWYHMKITGISGDIAGGNGTLKVSLYDYQGNAVFEDEDAGDFDTVTGINLIMTAASGITVYEGIDNVVFKLGYSTSAPDLPTISDNGENQKTITITAAASAPSGYTSTLYYKIGDNGAETVYTEPFLLANTARVFAWEVYVNENDPSDTLTSGIVNEYIYSNLATIQLNAPTMLERRGLRTFYIEASQDDKLGKPVPVIHLRDAAGNEYTQSGKTVHIEVPDIDASSSWTAWAECGEYSASETLSFTKSIFPVDEYAVTFEIDYTEICKANSSKPTIGTEIKATDSNNDNYVEISIGSTSLSKDDKIYYKVDSSQFRNGGVNGLAQYNRKGYIYLKELSANQVLYVNSSKTVENKMNLVAGTGNLANSGKEYFFTLTGAGDVAAKVFFQDNDTHYLYAIRVYSPAVASVDGIGVATLDELATKVVAGSVVKPQNSTSVASIETNLASGLYLANNNDGTYTATAFNAPTAEVTSVSGINQTVTITADDGLSIYTSTDGENYTLLGGTTLTLSSAANPLYVKTATTSAGGTLVYSAAVTLVVNAGTEVKCAAPTSVTARGLSALYVNDSQSSVTPVKPSTYRTMYKIGDGETKETTNHFIDFEEANGTVITVWCEADGYAASDSVTFTVSRPSADDYIVRDEADFAAWTRNHKGATTHLYSGDNVEKFTTSGDFEFMPISFDSADKLCSSVVWGTAKDDYNKSRWYTLDSKGVYTYSVTQLIAIKDCKAGDLIYFNSVAAKLPPAESKYYCDASAVNSNLAVADGISGGNYENWYIVQADGNAYIMVEQGSGNPVFAIRVYSPAAAKVNGVGYVTVDAAIEAAAESGGSVEVVDGSTLSGQNITLKPGVAITGLGETTVGDVTITTTVGGESVDMTSYYKSASLAVVNGTISPELDDTKVAPVVDTSSSKPMTVTSDTVSFAVDADSLKTGLYYGVGTRITPNGEVTHGAMTLCTDSNAGDIKFTAALPGDDDRVLYYFIEASDTDLSPAVP